MRYRPFWLRILFLAIILHVGVISAFYFFKSSPAQVEEKNLQEIEWVEVENNSAEEIAQDLSQPAENFPEIEFFPIEIPATPEPTLQEPIKPVESPKTAQVEKKSEVEEKISDNDSADKLKVLSKVLPRDILEELISTGAISERRELQGEKIILAVTVGVDGKVKAVEFRRGGNMNENGNLINILAEAAAARWIFEPFKNSDGEAIEMKTQIEFGAEDF